MDVIVPVYNHSRFIEQCLNSLLRQSVAFERIVVVDDASKDASVLPMLRAFSEHNDRLTLVTHDRNQGIGATQNTGLAHCRSDLVAFVDCDDYIAENAVDELHRAAIGRTPPLYMFTDRVNVGDHGEALDVIAAEEMYAGKASIADALLDGMFASHLKAISRGAIATVGAFAAGTDGVQDWDIALKLSEIGSFTHVKQPLYSHRIHAAQRSSTDRTAIFRKTNDVRRGALLRRGVRPSGRRRLSARLRGVVRAVHARLRVRIAEDPDGFVRTVGPGMALMITEAGTSLFLLDEVLFNPDFACPANSVLMVVPGGWADLGRLRFVAGIREAYLVMAPMGTPDSCSVAQWFNSYFETIAPLTPEAELACLGFLWDGAECLSTAIAS